MEHKTKIYRKFPYKYKAYADVKKEIIQRFYKLKSYNYKDRLLQDKPYVLRGMEKLEEDDILFKGHYTVLLTKGSDYDDFNVLSDFFNEKCRMKCILIGRKISPYDYWQKNYKKIHKYALKKYHKIDNTILRESLYELTSECTSHRPTNIIALLQLFNMENAYVLDSSGGWGDRLIGSLASDRVKMYVATDPSPCVHQGYQKIIKFFHAEDRAKVYQMGFEQFDNPDGYVFNLLYTSPPYFTMEKYSSDPNQSIIKYSNEKLWFENFLKVLLNKAIQYVKKDGIIAINIGMISGNTYVYDMLDYMKNEKKDQVEYLGIISYSDPNFKSINPIFIWRNK